MADAPLSEEMSIEDIKLVLLDSFWGTERGLNASSDTRAEINELITQLEARNPTPMPNEAQDKLSGTWKLAYTSNSELIGLLALGRLPLVTVGDITQMVDGTKMSVENKVQLSWPLAKTSLAASADFEVRSPKLLQIEFKRGQIATPELISDLHLPSSLEVMGQTVDLSPLATAFAPLEQPLNSLVSAAASLLSGLPDLKFPIPKNANGKTSTWLLNTYLDTDLRITRGDLGSVFVMVKEEPIVAVPVELDSSDEWELNVPPAEPAPSPVEIAAELANSDNEDIIVIPKIEDDETAMNNGDV